MLSKEDFCKAINKIMDVHNGIQKINELNKDLSIAILNYSLQDTLIDILAKSMNLEQNEYYGNTISWWVYDCNFGKTNWLVRLNERDFVLNTPEQLYDFCVLEGKQNA